MVVAIMHIKMGPIGMKASVSVTTYTNIAWRGPNDDLQNEQLDIAFVRSLPSSGAS
jgi:hypothetical protein